MRDVAVTFAPDQRQHQCSRALVPTVRGLPLGIELAAAQMRTRSVAGLVGELEQQPGSAGRRFTRPAAAPSQSARRF